MEKKLFGTDGIRGKANHYPITPEVMIKVGRAIVRSLPAGKDKKRIIIGKDTRISGDMIESAIAAGICSAGGDAFLAGVIPTPAISFFTASENFDAGIVISASHNPYEDNGIKIFNHQGFKLSDAVESAIESKVMDETLSFNNLFLNKIGVIKNFDFARDKYIEFLKKYLPRNFSLNGIKLILDCSNGATYAVAPRLFEELGANVHTICASPNGTNINDGCGSEHTETLCKAVIEHGAAMGFAFDGDGDRLIAVDSNGNKVTGDQILAVCAKFMKENGRLQNNTAVSTVMSNVGRRQALKEMEIAHIMADVGDRYVLEAMKKHKAVIGGEDSGHMIFLDHHTSGDGIFTALRLIRVITETNQPLSKLVNIISIYPQVLLNVPVKKKIDIRSVSEICNKIDEVENQLKDQGRVLVRYSGTQPLCRVMVEGPDQDDTRRFCQEIADVIAEKLGSK
jgi:phosphoglucosamine mutase